MDAKILRGPTKEKLYGDRSDYRSGELVVQVPDYDFDVVFKMPNGQTLQAQFRSEGSSLDICLPSRSMVNCWKDDDLTPAKPLVKDPHCLVVKQVCFCLNPKLFQE